MRSMLFGKTPLVALSVHNKDAPNDSEWAESCHNVELCLDVLGSRGLVVTDGGHPGHLQRALFNKVMRGRAIPAAVVTNAPVPRMVVNMLNVFNPSVKAFGSAQLEQALRYILLPEDQWPALRSALLELNETVGSTTVKQILRL